MMINYVKKCSLPHTLTMSPYAALLRGAIPAKCSPDYFCLRSGRISHRGAHTKNRRNRRFYEWRP